jgi:hypothetical protein
LAGFLGFKEREVRKFTFCEMMREAQREAANRRSYYPKRVQEGTLDLDTAYRRIALMEQIALELGQTALYVEEQARRGSRSEPAPEPKLEPAPVLSEADVALIKTIARYMRDKVEVSITNDAEIARFKEIAEGLFGAGIEVWIDQEHLVLGHHWGGDRRRS